MNIFDVSLLERAESVQTDKDSVEILVNGVTISYRKYLNGFEPVLDVELDGSSYYRNYTPETPDELTAARSFFACALDEDFRRRTVNKFPVYDKLKLVFAETSDC